jgi:HAMP domain-containing protein
MRGSSVKMQRSLRTRVLAACALAFLGLSGVVCLVLPRAYETQRRDVFVNHSENLARGLAFLLAQGAGQNLDSLAGWLIADPDFEGAAILQADGHVVAKFPSEALSFGENVPEVPRSVCTAAGCVAFHPLGGEGAAAQVVAVRLSSRSLVRDFENVRWLFASIFLFTSGVFFILSQYLTRTILSPIEQIGRAAMNLADGEPVVEVPKTGDREIDDLGEFIEKLGDSRRQSRVMTSPMDVLIAQSWGHAPKKTESARPAADPPQG